MALEIWIPPSARAEPQDVLRCNLCGKRIPATHQEQHLRHMRACVKRNKDRIDAAVERLQADPFRQPADKERYAYVRKRAAERKEI